MAKVMGMIMVNFMFQLSVMLKNMFTTLIMDIILVDITRAKVATTRGRVATHGRVATIHIRHTIMVTSQFILQLMDIISRKKIHSLVKNKIV
uniref:Putative secreted protein n=1 Tax=Panstrongylus lignarius TaxID=156445 RepID=A0A224XRL0_9HEMI